MIRMHLHDGPRDGEMFPTAPWIDEAPYVDVDVGPTWTTYLRRTDIAADVKDQHYDWDEDDN